MGATADITYGHTGTLTRAQPARPPVAKAEVTGGTAKACTWHSQCVLKILWEDTTSASSTACLLLLPLQVPREYSLFSQLMDARNKETQQPLSDLEICAQTFTLLLAGGKGRVGRHCALPASGQQMPLHLHQVQALDGADGF